MTGIGGTSLDISNELEGNLQDSSDGRKETSKNSNAQTLESVVNIESFLSFHLEIFF